MNALRILVATLLVTGLTLAATPANAVSECSTPDPRNAYDYCVAAEPVSRTVRMVNVDLDYETPFCFPVPVVGSICPRVVDTTSPVELQTASAALTYLYVGAQVHSNYLADTVCHMLPPALWSACLATAIEPGASGMSNVALADLDGDGAYDGVAVLVGLPVCPIGFTCVAQWFYVGA